MSRPRFTAAQVAEALAAARGVKSHAARALGCSRQTVDNYIARHESVAAAYRQAREALLDDAEAALARAIDRDEPWAVRFALSTLGKERGYTERTEQLDLDPDGQAVSEFEAAILRVYGGRDGATEGSHGA